MAAVSATAATTTTAAVNAAPEETIADYDECDEFRLDSSNDAMKDYEKTVLAITTLTSVMGLKERTLKQYNDFAYQKGAQKHLQDYGEEQLIGQVEDGLEQLRRHETAMKDAAQLVKVLSTAIEVCPQPPTYGAKDRKGLQTKIDTVNNKHLKSHSDIFSAFSTALAGTCYYYLTARKQTTNWQYLTWKVTSYSVVFEQYSDYRLKETLAKRAFASATPLPSTAALTSPTAATTDSKQPPVPPPSSASSPSATTDTAKPATPATPSTPSAASATPPPTSPQSAALSSLSVLFGPETPK